MLRASCRIALSVHVPAVGCDATASAVVGAVSPSPFPSPTPESISATVAMPVGGNSDGSLGSAMGITWDDADAVTYDVRDVACAVSNGTEAATGAGESATPPTDPALRPSAVFSDTGTSTPAARVSARAWRHEVSTSCEHRQRPPSIARAPGARICSARRMPAPGRRCVACTRPQQVQVPASSVGRHAKGVRANGAAANP